MERQTSACRQGVRLHQRGGEGNGEAAVEEEGGCECRGAWASETRALEMSAIYSGWWFGTFLFSHIFGIIFPID